MSINSFDGFGEMHRSVLQEICNMGAGNAATAVSEMINQPTDISTPQVKISPPALAGKVADMLSRGGETYYINLFGDLSGSLLFVFPREFTDRFTKALFGDAFEGSSELADIAASAVREAVNVSAAAFANNFALLSGLMVDISVPEKAAVPSEKILASCEGAGSSVCFVNISTEIVDGHNSFTTMFFPELQSVQELMRRLGVSC